VTVAVNLSPRQLRDPRLLATVSGAIKEAGIPSESLCMGITESALVEDISTTAAVLEELGHQGVQLAIDDFGTGYSSMSYLKRLPVDVLKIDRSFVVDLTSDTRDHAIARAVIDLAHSLDLTVVAEGVETQAGAVALTSRARRASRVRPVESRIDA
jgi:EAL domain-containing protein (putative c-di-GMP-specific phosphodiesterase class I)